MTEHCHSDGTRTSKQATPHADRPRAKRASRGCIFSPQRPPRESACTGACLLLLTEACFPTGTAKSELQAWRATRSCPGTEDTRIPSQHLIPQRPSSGSRSSIGRGSKTRPPGNQTLPRRSCEVTCKVDSNPCAATILPLLKPSSKQLLQGTDKKQLPKRFPRP